MKIIRQGKVKPNTYNKTCSGCDTEFEYTSKDVQPDSRDGNYVICPVCKAFIAHGNGIHYGHRQ